MGRKRPVAQISFFSFQDIIISISGVIIVIVLLLALELTQSSEAKNNESGIAASAMAELQKSLIEYQNEIESLKSQIDEYDQTVQKAIENPEGEVNKRIKKLESDVRANKKSLAKAQAVGEQLQSEKEQLDGKQPEQLRQLSELQQLRDRIEKTKQEIDALKKSKDVVYKVPKGLNKQGWLCVFSKNMIEVLPMGNNAVGTVINRTSTAKPTTKSGYVKKFMDWTSSGGRSSDYFLVLIRPSGIDAYNALQKNWNGRRDITFGYDIVSEKQSVKGL